ncbi:MAG TPA: hybrid sensor histidine kinase/response regulator [Candidatus Kapabacteria bacterium]|nr:hybrid sensor histidine kinase/response regulator [Candidatus Kapabacteria bacterium]
MESHRFPGQNKPKPLILVAEDVPRNMEIVCNILRKEDYRIAAAGNGRQVLEMVPLVRPDLILLDVMMPEMDGFEVCQRLKSSPETKDIPVIFLTAKTETLDIVKGFEIGAVDYVTKPFNGMELMSRVKTHLELKFSRERLKELVAARDTFFSIIAHDLRNLLQYLILSADTLYNSYDSLEEERKKDYIQRFYHCSYKISGLLENLLAWSQSQRGMIEYYPEKIDIGALVAENIELLKEDARKKGIAIDSGIEPGIIVFADRNMIRTVIRNLLGNGVKFTDTGGEVRVSASKTGVNVEINVTDTGVGMNDEEIAALFRIDRRQAKIGTAKEKGSGLGLILCKDFIEKNKGTIEVTSAPGKGSSFRIKLPGGSR